MTNVNTSGYLCNDEICKLSSEIVSTLKNDGCFSYVQDILRRLCFEKDIRKIIDVCHNLMGINDWRIRLIAAEIVPLDMVLEMICDESCYDVMRVLIRRLYENRNSNKVKMLWFGLMNTKSKKGRMILAAIAPVKKLEKIAINEDRTYIVEILLERFSNIKNKEELCNRLITARHWKIRLFAADYVSSNILLRMLNVEDNYIVRQKIKKLLKLQ